MKKIHTLEEFLKLRTYSKDTTVTQLSGDAAFLDVTLGDEKISIYNSLGELKQEIDTRGKWINAIHYHHDIGEKGPNKETLYVGGAFLGKVSDNGQIEEIIHSHDDKDSKITFEGGKNLFDALFNGLIYGMNSHGNFIEFSHDNDMSMRVLYHPSENKFYIGKSILERGFRIEGKKAVTTELPKFVNEEIKNLKRIKEKYGILTD